jgi:hypothetical protein
MLGSTLRPLSIGEILDGSFTLYRRHFLVFYATGLLALAPVVLTALLVSPVLAQFLNFPFTMVLYIALVWEVSEAALGRRPAVGAGLRAGFRRFLPVCAALMVVGLLTFTLPAMLLGVGVGMRSGLVILLGLLAFFFVGVPLYLRYFAVYQLVTLEGEKRFLKRSAALARGALGKILVVAVISGIIAALPAMAVGASLGFYSSFTAGEPPSRIGFALEVLATSLTAPFSVGAMTLLYYDQRVRKEGLDVTLAGKALEELPLLPNVPAGPTVQN